MVGLIQYNVRKNKKASASDPFPPSISLDLAHLAGMQIANMNETTLVLLKPDCLAKRHCGDVIKRFEKAGLEIVGCKMMFLSEQLLAEHYAHILDKPFYPDVQAFMQSSPTIAVALSGENAVALVRELMGPTDPAKAAPGTIRRDFGEDVKSNVVHGSDSPENALAELKRFFSDEELFSASLKR